MEKLFESKFMIKLQDFGQKLGNNKFLTALQAAMMSLMGIIMVGAIFQIITSVLGPTMFKVLEANTPVYNMLYLPYQFTMNVLSLWVVAFFAYNYAKKLNMISPIMNAIDALICFLVVAGGIEVSKEGIKSINMTYLGSQGMFIGFLVVFMSVQIEKFCVDKKIGIKMPDVVPPFLQNSFNSIIPLLMSMLVFLGISSAVSFGTEGSYTVASGFMKVLSVPLSSLGSVPGMFILCTFAGLLWCFGIHGTMIIVPVIMPLLIQASAANGEAMLNGEPLVFYPVLLCSAMSIAGGTGNTLALALMGLRSKSKQISAVAKISAIPGWFGINEPLAFGMPIMYNPILSIPYVLNIPIAMLCTYFAYKIGFLTPPWINVSGTLPMGFLSYFRTLSWKNAIWDYIIIIPSALVWYPFFKAYEKQLVEKEKQIEA